MAEYTIMKAVEFDKLPAPFRKVYRDVDALEGAGWWLQLKYDGCFGAVDTTAGTMSSRTGESVHSCDHIISRCIDRFGSGHVVLGEVWHPRLGFPKISGQFRRRLPSPDLTFVVNDMLTVDEFYAGLSVRKYRDRYEDYHSRIWAVTEYSPVLGAATFASYKWTNATKLADAWCNDAAGGFDGVVLRNPDSPWIRGPVKNGALIKVKPARSLDLEVVGFDVKLGEKTGRGVLTLDVTCGGVVTTVGSGVPHSLCGPDVVGKIIEVAFLGITADGKLREPRFKGVRFDKLEPDA